MRNFDQIRLLICIWAAKYPKFCHFGYLVMSPLANRQRTEKVERGCTTANLPLSNGIKIVSIVEQLHGEIVRRNSVVQKA